MNGRPLTAIERMRLSGEIQPGDHIEMMMLPQDAGFVGSSIPPSPDGTLKWKPKVIELLEALVAEARETNRLLRGEPALEFKPVPEHTGWGMQDADL